jgi:hypothetical protein
MRRGDFREATAPLRAAAELDEVLAYFRERPPSAAAIAPERDAENRNPVFRPHAALTAWNRSRS